MGLFKKKRDPISERSRALNDEIAALEAQIKRLSEGEAQPETPAEAIDSASPFRPPATPAPAQNSSNHQPKLRSTARPYGQAMVHPPASDHQEPVRPKPREPVFEDFDHANQKPEPEPPTTAAHYNELGVRKYDLPAFWRRLRNNFRGPATTNPKLVSYLAAGSIQGLRPLRYEKRVARNRFLILVAILIVVLWGIIVAFFRRS